MPITNVLLVRAAYGWDERTRPSSITTYGRRENLYGLGANPSPADVARTADARLDIIATPRYQYDAEHQPLSLTELAYHGYGVGDTLPMTVDSGNVTERVISLAVSEDDVSGQATVTGSFHDVVMYASPLENFVAMLSQAVKKMIPGTGRGDWKEAQPVTPPAVPAPVSAWVPPVSACVTESFDKADSDTIGPDQTWEQTAYSGSSGGNHHALLRVSSDQLALAATDTSGYHAAYAREAADCGSADMTVSLQITGFDERGFGEGIYNQEYGVFARMIDGIDDPTDFNAGNFVGWHFTVTRYYDGLWYPWLEEAYYDAGGGGYTGIGAAASYQNGTGFSGGSEIGPFDVGDRMSLTVTGTGDTTRVICECGGSTLLDVQGEDLVAMNYYPGSIPPGQDTATYARWATPIMSTGQRGGISLAGQTLGSWTSGEDDLVTVDDFSACPA